MLVEASDFNEFMARPWILSAVELFYGKVFGKDSGFTTLVVKTVADLFAPETQTVPANIRTFL